MFILFLFTSFKLLGKMKQQNDISFYANRHLKMAMAINASHNMFRVTVIYSSSFHFNFYSCSYLKTFSNFLNYTKLFRFFSILLNRAASSRCNLIRKDIPFLFNFFVIFCCLNIFNQNIFQYIEFSFLSIFCVFFLNQYNFCCISFTF